MSAVVAVSEAVVFGIGAVIFIAVATAAFGLGMARFSELGERNEDEEQRRERG
jgi:hypothetical protein